MADVPFSPIAAPHERHFAAVMPDGRVRLLWSASGYSATVAAELPEGAVAVELSSEDAAELRAALEAGGGHWYDASVSEFRERSVLELRGLPEDRETVGPTEIYRVAAPAPTSVSLEWDGPGEIMLRIGGNDVLAARPVLVELPESGDYQIEIADPRYLEEVFVLSVE